MLGLKHSGKTQEIFKISESEKRHIIEDYLQSGLTKSAIWEKYSGQKEDHGRIVRWMREYGYLSKHDKKNVTFVTLNMPMDKQPKPQESKPQESVSDFEYLQLQKRILELEKQLQESEMKTIAWQTMVEIAEREFNISIKKKYSTKPSKK